MRQGFPITAFEEGDILISPGMMYEHWLLRNGKLEKINDVGIKHEIRTPSPDETFYRMATSMDDALSMKLDQAYKNKLLSEEEHVQFLKMIKFDHESRHLLNLILDNRINEVK